MFDYLEFGNPGRLWLLLILLPLGVWYYFKLKNYNATLKFSSVNDFGDNKLTFKKIMAYIPMVLNFVIIALIIVAIARPQTSQDDEKVETEGIDVVLAMDISGSMEARDFRPNRLEAAKNVACEFIQARDCDRMGIVLFSGESFTQCPLTSDRSTLVNIMRNIKNGIIDDGTAIGLGLANAIARIKDSDAKSKVIILLTDGMNNCGEIDPLTAASIAENYGIRVYTIGVGTNGEADFPVQDPFGRIVYQKMEVQIDEPTLTKIAKITGGKYFRATNNKALKEVYEQIDQMEKTKMQSLTIHHVNEKFFPFLLAASILLLLNILIKYTVGRILP